MANKEKIETIYVDCGICGNSSGYDKETLKASTWTINGTELVICCPCEDELREQLINSPKFNEGIKRFLQDKYGNVLGNDDLEIIADTTINILKGHEPNLD